MDLAPSMALLRPYAGARISRCLRRQYPKPKSVCAQKVCFRETW